MFYSFNLNEISGCISSTFDNLDKLSIYIDDIQVFQNSCSEWHRIEVNLQLKPKSGSSIEEKQGSDLTNVWFTLNVANMTHEGREVGILGVRFELKPLRWSFG